MDTDRRSFTITILLPLTITKINGLIDFVPTVLIPIRRNVVAHKGHELKPVHVVVVLISVSIATRKQNLQDHNDYNNDVLHDVSSIFRYVCFL